jgi:hypothetical protein
VAGRKLYDPSSGDVLATLDLTALNVEGVSSIAWITSWFDPWTGQEMAEYALIETGSSELVVLTVPYP